MNKKEYNKRRPNMNSLKNSPNNKAIINWKAKHNIITQISGECQWPKRCYIIKSIILLTTVLHQQTAKKRFQLQTVYLIGLE